jgi:DedD protein
MGLFSRRQDGAEPSSGSRRTPAKAAPRGPSRSQPLDAGEPLDPAQTQKRRARRRLIGAAVLVLGVIVFLPMVFDPGPKPLADDIMVQIPDKESAFNPAVPGKAPVKPAAIDGKDAAPAAVPAAPAVAPAASPAAAALPAKVENGAGKAVDQAADKTAGKGVDKPADKAAEKTAAKPVANGEESTRALALLEGKAADAKAADAKSADSKSADSKSDNPWAVQIGAFASADKVKDLRAKLGAAGLKSYVETIKTPQGDRTRVRVGPFPTRDAAEKARERVKKHLVIDGSVVSS